MRRDWTVWAAMLIALCAPGCSSQKKAPPRTVVVYTALDQVYAEPILKDFERQSGIRVLPQYDAESAKTTGLVNRLIARRDSPECDVLWSNEIVQTERLAQMGLLASYASPQAQRIPSQFRDPANQWTGFAARMRVIIYNTQQVSPAEVPAGLQGLTLPRWRGRVAIARPLFGTTLTHMAILRQELDAQRLKDYLQALRSNQVALCAGNATVRDLVAAGERSWGLTDTDDAYQAMQEGKPVAVAIPDPSEGAVLIPNTVAMIAKCPHSAEAKELIDYLLSSQVERRLAEGPGAQIPLGMDLADTPTPWTSLLKDSRIRKVDVVAAARSMEELVELLKQAGMDQ